MPEALTIEEKKEKALEKQVRNNSERPAQERKRNVFNGTQGKLSVNYTIEGYHLHGFNDENGRIADALDGGYEFVTPEEVGGVKENVVSRNTDLGDKVRWLVGRTTEGGPLYCYLMKIKQEWFEEDQAILQAKNNLIDDAIRKGRNTKDGSSAEGFYAPREGINYKT
jgi:hypothetical protein